MNTLMEKRENPLRALGLIFAVLVLLIYSPKGHAQACPSGTSPLFYTYGGWFWPYTNTVETLCDKQTFLDQHSAAAACEQQYPRYDGGVQCELYGPAFAFWSQGRPGAGNGSIEQPYTCFGSGASNVWTVANLGLTCGSGYYLKNSPPADQGNCDPCQGMAAKEGSASTKKPINPGSGNEHFSETDYRSGDGRLTFTRSFNNVDPTPSAFSPGWHHNFEGRRIIPLSESVPIPPPNVRYVTEVFSDPTTACQQGWKELSPNSGSATYLGNYQCQIPGGAILTVYNTNASAGWIASTGVSGVAVQRPDGSLYPFNCSAGVCSTNSDIPLRLVPSSAGYTLTDEDDTIETYDTNGVLQTVAYKGGYTQTMRYSGTLLATVSDSFGRSLTFSYGINNASSTVQTVGTPDGTLKYSYDSQNRLQSVTNLDNSLRTYQYPGVANSFNTIVTSVVDESNNNYLTISYNSSGIATSSGLAGGVWANSIDYTNLASPKVTDARGIQRTYNFITVNGRQKLSSITGSPCFTCVAPQTTTYDSAGYYQSTTDWNGNVTRYTYDDTRGLELSRTEAYGTSQQRTVSTTWDANFRLPDQIDEPGRRTTFTYDSAGNLLTKTVKDTATNTSRTWTYSNYTAWGTPQTIDGPRTDVADITQIAYYPIVSGDSKSGQVHTITDALGHVTTVNSYDPSSRPLQITDSNGLVTTLAYSPRGWLTSRQAGSELTQYSYYPTGLLQRVTLPSGAYLQYSYNAAHQLTQVQDQLGDRIVYTPDVMGNNTSTKVYDPNSNLTQTQSRVYNSLNELYQSIGAQNQTTTYGYDNNGNLTSVSDPLSHSTGNAYDALNRLIQVTDPNQGATKYNYNALDQLTGITDPRSLVTSYGVDALNNTGAVHSPDSGNTTATYDAAGNVLTRTDAKNQITHYQYDALNRLIQITRADNSVIGFTYDQGSNGIGRLTGMSDLSGSTSWSYDANGHVTKKSVTIGSQTLTTAYGYDAATGHLLSMTLPSGKVVGYSWTNGQITALNLGGNPLASNIVYQPFAGPKSWTLANGETASRSYDLDGRIVTDPVETIGYDGASRTTTWALGKQSALSGSQGFGYDNLDRITSYTGTGGPISYGYDANGSRNTQTVNGTTTTYAVDSNSNRINSQTAPGLLGIPSTTNLSYDANGSLTKLGSANLSYDVQGRLTGFGVGLTTGTYVYNGLGQRAKKTANFASTVFIYDEAAHLIGEYNSSGSLTEETIYIGNMPIAVNKPLGTYYVHADYRNAPRQIDDSNKAPVWEWDPTPFGEGQPNQQPSQQTPSFTYNLRFPGQYYDSESTASNNLFRDYYSNLGRYIESDPIGLVGGINTYAYVGGNPVNHTDHLGLLCDGCEVPPVMQQAFANRQAASPFVLPVVGTAAAFLPFTDLFDGLLLARRMAEVRRLGKAGEDAVCAAKDIGPKTKIFINGRGRIPDGLTDTALSEVKNVQSLSYTQQLQDFAAYAEQEGLDFNLYVRPGANLSGPLLDAEAAGRVNITQIPFR